MKKVDNSVSPLLKSFRRVLHMLTNFELLSNQPVSLLSDRDDFFSVTLLVWIFFNQLVLRGLLFKDFWIYIGYYVCSFKRAINILFLALNFKTRLFIILKDW